MAASKLRSSLKRDSLSRSRRLSPAQRVAQGQACRADAWVLFNAGMRHRGFSRTAILKLWRAPADASR